MTARPRVLLINYEYPPLGGGAGTATRGIARAMAAQGCDVTVLTSRFRGQPRREQTDGFTVVRVPVLRRREDRANPIEMVSFMISAACALAPLTRTWRPDLSIAFFTIPSGPLGWLLRMLRGTPFIVSLRGGDVPGFEWAPAARRYHRVTAPLLRWIWRRADAVVANSSGLRELALRSTPELPIVMIPNGAELPAHVSAQPPDGRTPRLLTMGRLTQQKGIDVLFRALARLRDLDFALDIAGDGPERARLKELAQHLGIAARVRFLGWVPREEIPHTYANASAFVLASRIEGMPNVVLEAMAYARPVICTRVFGTDELVVHGETGWLVETGDEAALADGIRALLRDAELRSRMGAASRARVEAFFTWRRTAVQYLDLADLRVPGAATPALLEASR